MWILTGPFDCEEHEIPTKTKSKLLKTGVTYILGRKEDAASLVIRKKNISRAHFKIDVIEEPNADLTDPSYRPRLTIVNTIPEGKKAVSRRMDRADGQPAATLNPNEIVDVDEGNVIHVVLDVRMTASWVQVACLAPPTRGLSVPDPLEYGPLGISVRPTPHPDITHHLTPTITLTAELALSLISVASLVSPNWLADLIKAGQAKRGELSALETTFLLPSVDKYRPTFSQTLPSSLKEFKKWAPNEARAAFFRGFRFVFIGEKGREAQEAMRELVKRGLGEYECVAVEGGRAALRKVLSKGRAKGRILVLVGEESVLVPAVGNDGWQELVDEAKSFEVNFTSRERILEAVVEADASLLNPNATQSTGPSVQEGLSPLPDVVPNTHPEEPSIPSATSEPAPASQSSMRSRLRRRAGSRASSRAPSPPPAAPSQAPPSNEAHLAEQPKRRGLIRRAGRSRMVDDLSVELDSDGTPAPSSQPMLELARAPSIGPEPTLGRSRLKRRAGTHAANTDIIDLTSDAPAHGVDEPPLKKFRTLFEESDPDRLQSQLTTQSESVTQSESTAMQSGTRTRFGGITQLAAVAEEEEESTSGATQGMGTQSQGVKRKGRVADEDEDVELEDAVAPASKRRSVEGANSVQPSQTQDVRKPPSHTDSKLASRVSQSQKAQKATGAAPGKPDTDEAFLKAVASTKKGKRTEDTFDREFNNLRISKPELEKAQERDAWAVLDDFGDDRDLRGNFMVILEMEVPEKPRRPALVRDDEGRADWAGRADFKKFKKKSATSRGPAVDVYAEDDNDYELSSQLWKARSHLTSQSQSLSQEAHKPEPSQSRRLRTQTQTQRAQAGKAKAKAVVLDDFDEESAPQLQPSKSRRKGSNRATSTQPRMRTLKTQPLFDGSDEEAEAASQTMTDDNLDPIEEADVFDEDEESVLRASGRKMQGRVRQSNKAGGSKHSAPKILDDDSDDEAAFVGFGTRTNASRK